MSNDLKSAQDLNDELEHCKKKVLELEEQLLRINNIVYYYHSEFDGLSEPMTRALSSVMYEQIKKEKEEVLRKKEFNEYWFATRLQHLKDLCKKHNIFQEYCNIVANGTPNANQPPTYQQQLNFAVWEKDKALEKADYYQKKYIELEDLISKLFCIHHKGSLENHSREKPHCVACEANEELFYFENKCVLWRESVESALGLEPDLENHNPDWAREIILEIRERGNKK